MKKADKQELLALLEEHYGQYACGLHFRDPYTLLIATMLSAQCTDARVNLVTGPLFERYPDVKDMAEATQEELEGYIKTCGLYKSKARHIIDACRQLMLEHGGEVPAVREALEKLPGVGRKTANVVLSNAFGQPAIAVDTHVFRVSNRMGLVKADNVRDTEEALMKAIPKEKWSAAHHWLIWHGRLVCTARAPQCQSCPVAALCEAQRRKKDGKGA